MTHGNCSFIALATLRPLAGVCLTIPVSLRALGEPTENEDAPVAKSQSGPSSESDTPAETSSSEQSIVEKQKGCLLLVKTGVRLKFSHRYSVVLPDNSETKAVVKKSGQAKAQILLQNENKKCPSYVGKNLKIKAESAEKVSLPPVPAKKGTAGESQKNKQTVGEKTSGKNTEHAGDEPPSAAAKNPPNREYRIEGGAGYGFFLQNISAANPFIAEAKTEKISSLSGPVFYGGLKGIFPLSGGNSFFVGGRYQQFSGAKEVELGSGSPTFKYSVKVGEYVFRPGFMSSQCFGLGFTCALSGMVAKVASSKVLLGAAEQPPESPMDYLRFGGGIVANLQITSGFNAHLEVDASGASGKLTRGDSQKVYSISPTMIAIVGGLELSL